MRTITLILLILCTLPLLPLSLNGQAPDRTLSQSLFVLGNLEELGPKHPSFDRLDDLIEKQEGEVVVLIAGDFIDADGLELEPTPQEIAKLQRLMALGNSATQILFLPGDREWDNAKKEGLKKVKELEDYIKKEGGDRHHFLTEDGCPGPDVLDIGKSLRIVALNTHWFVHDHKRPEEQDTDCDLLNESEMWEELEDLLQPDGERNLIIAAHHPAISYGQYAGYKQARRHFLAPIVGSFIAGYHQNVGNSKDLANEGMAAFSGRMEDLLERFHGVIYTSGHEYDIQVNANEDNYHINSGALRKGRPSARGEFHQYRQKDRGLVQLRFFKDGEVDLLVYDSGEEGAFKKTHQQMLYTSPCKEQAPDSENEPRVPVNEQYLPCMDLLYPVDATLDTSLAKTGTVIAGEEYEAGFIHRIFIGKHYRKAWTTPVQDIPYLDLDNIYGGLNAYAKGGAAQTRSVRFKSGDGQVFAFRSVNKDPTQKKDKDLASGLAADIFKDITSSQHPYAGNILDGLMTAADIPNPDAKLYILPDHPKLGPFRKEFKGMLGYLEKRPKSKKKGRKPYRDADKVYNTSELNKLLLKDHNHQLELQPYLQARLFDMWVSDWDRHGGNWSWLGYGDKKKKMTFKPFAKDRDKALTRMDGLFRVLDFPMVARDMHRFRKSVRGLKSLNFKSRNMDRQHLVTYSLPELLKETADFQKIMTDEVIESSVRQLPPEVYPFDGPKIAETLKIRRDKMPKLMSNYYKLLAKKVHFIGSNEDEIFEVKRQENGDVHIAMYKKTKKGEKGDLLKERLCKISETKEIQLFGLGGKDEFNIEGTVRKSILVRVIGGKGKDQVKDESVVRRGGKRTKVYDYKQKDKLQLGKEGKWVKIPEEISFKTDGFFGYDHFLVVPFVIYNADDGAIFTLTGQTVKQKFNKPGFGSRYNYSLQISTIERINFAASADFRHVFGKWDLSIGGSGGSPDYLFPEFFGLGNELIINDSLRQLDYYENEMASANFNIGLSRIFWQHSLFSAEMVSEYHNVKPDSRAEGGASIYDFFPQDKKTSLLGPRIRLDLDFRDSRNFPTRGIQLVVSDYTFLNSNADWKLGGRLDAEISSFWTLAAKTPLTLGIKGGVSKAYGETPFYYQSFLGQTNRLRGFRKNRFAGNSSVFLNSELRWHIGRIQTRIAPFYWGLFGFYDVGRTYLEGENSDQFHSAYGGGFYMIPYNMKSFNVVVTLARSEEESALLSFGVGFFIN